MDKYTSLRSVSLASQTPYKMWTICEDDVLKPILDLPGVSEPFNQLRQSLPLAYWQNGYLDVMPSSLVMDKGLMSGDQVMPLVITDPIVDIDYRAALAEAEDLLVKISSRKETFEIEYPA